MLEFTTSFSITHHFISLTIMPKSMGGHVLPDLSFFSSLFNDGPDSGWCHLCSPAIEDQISLILSLDHDRSGHEEIGLYQVADS